MIRYFKHDTTPAGTYSIDYFTFDFLLLCTEAQLQFTFLSVIERYSSSCPEFQHFQSNKFGYPKEIYQFSSVHIEISESRAYQFSPDAQFQKRASYKLSLSFNPNKAGDDALVKDLFFSLEIFLGVIGFRCRRCDFTFDIREKIENVYILSRKTESNWKSTRYYGVRENSGYLRVYDKREEIKQKEKKDIGEDVTRLEWEMRNEKEFSFDTFSIPDFSGLDGTARFLMEVPPERIQHALRLVSRPTAAKIRKKCFTPYPFEPERFQALYDAYMSFYGIPTIKLKCEKAQSDIALENSRFTFTWDEDIVNKYKEESLQE